MSPALCVKTGRPELDQGKGEHLQKQDQRLIDCPLAVLIPTFHGHPDRGWCSGKSGEPAGQTGDTTDQQVPKRRRCTHHGRLADQHPRAIADQQDADDALVQVRISMGEQEHAERHPDQSAEQKRS